MRSTRTCLSSHCMLAFIAEAHSFPPCSTLTHNLFGFVRTSNTIIYLTHCYNFWHAFCIFTVFFPYTHIIDNFNMTDELMIMMKTLFQGRKHNGLECSTTSKLGYPTSDTLGQHGHSDGQPDQTRYLNPCINILFPITKKKTGPVIMKQKVKKFRWPSITL